MKPMQAKTVTTKKVVVRTAAELWKFLNRISTYENDLENVGINAPLNAHTPETTLEFIVEGYYENAKDSADFADYAGATDEKNLRRRTHTLRIKTD